MFLSQSTQTRLSGLDVLRNGSMLMVVLLHVSGVGGLLAALPAGSLRWWALWGLEALCSCAVNCYGLLSGYLGVGHKHPLSRLGSLWLQAAFYSAALTVLFGLLDPGSLRVRDMIAPFFPVLNGTYWYFSAYFALFLLMPFLDSALTSLSPASAKRLVLALIAVFSLADFISPEEIFSTRGGYSVAWLAVLYLLGGCLRLHPPARLPRPWLLLAGYVGFSLLALVGKTFGVSQPGAFFKWGILLSYTSPLILLAALCLFLALYRLPQSRGALGHQVVHRLFHTVGAAAVEVLHLDIAHAALQQLVLHRVGLQLGTGGGHRPDTAVGALDLQLHAGARLALNQVGAVIPGIPGQRGAVHGDDDVPYLESGLVGRPVLGDTDDGKAFLTGIVDRHADAGIYILAALLGGGVALRV